MVTYKWECFSCDPQCVDCDEGGCDECTAGYYLMEDSAVCVDNCPTAYEVDGDDCTNGGSDEKGDLLAHF